MFVSVLTGVESQPKLTPVEDATALTEWRFMQALQQMKLWQPRGLEATSEGYETMTVSSTPLCEVMSQIVLTSKFIVCKLRKTKDT